MNEADQSGTRGFFKRLRTKITQSSSWLTSGLREILPGRKIDADVLDELETRLITADVGVAATARILADLHKRVARKELADVDALLAALRDAMIGILKPVEKALVVDSSKRPYVILVIGINGAGKTTTIGKLAHRLLADKHTVLLASGDTFRAAAREQLETWAGRNGVPIVAQQQGAEPAAVIYDGLQAARARGIDRPRILGRRPHLDGTIGQNAVAQAEEFNRSLGVTGLVITKLDGTAKGGVVLAIAEKLKIPIRFVGVGEGIEDFGVFDAADFVTALLKTGPDDTAP